MTKPTTLLLIVLFMISGCGTPTYQYKVKVTHWDNTIDTVTCYSYNDDDLHIANYQGWHYELMGSGGSIYDIWVKSFVILSKKQVDPDTIK